jgi:hypothetical protein
MHFVGKILEGRIIFTVNIATNFFCHFKGIETF